MTDAKDADEMSPEDQGADRHAARRAARIAARNAMEKAALAAAVEAAKVGTTPPGQVADENPRAVRVDSGGVAKPPGDRAAGAKPASGVLDGRDARPNITPKAEPATGRDGGESRQLAKIETRQLPAEQARNEVAVVENA